MAEADTEPESEPDGDAERPLLYRCLDCDAPIPDLVVTSYCEACGAHLGDDRFLIDEATPALLEALSAEADGCLACGGDVERVFCSTACSEDWFATYTDAYLRQ